MADALCGPSNALQNLHKNSSVDRSLQQDRLTLRRAPFDGFRSADSNAGILDPEFQAFQASQPAPLHFSGAGPLTETRLFGFRGKQTALNSLGPSSDWASDFQRLQVSPLPSAQHVPLQAPQAHLSAHTPSYATTGYAQQQRGTSGNPLAYIDQYSGAQIMQQTMPWDGPSIFAGPRLQQGVVEEQFAPNMFDDAAFERAFEAAGHHLANEETLPQANSISPGTPRFLPAFEHYPHLQLLYTVMREAIHDPTPAKMHMAALSMSLLEENDLSRVRGQAMHRLERMLYSFCGPEGVPFADAYQLAQRANSLLRTFSWEKVDALPLQKLPAWNPSMATATHEELRADIRQQLQSLRSHDLAERVMEAIPRDLYDAENATESRQKGPERVWSELWDQVERQARDSVAVQWREAGPHIIDQMPTANLKGREHVQNQQEPSRSDDNDELARTAADLLQKVENNQSEKFQNSSFLGLMRRLRDREVRVEGDQVVETGQSVPPAQQQNSTYRSGVSPVDVQQPVGAAQTTSIESADIEAQRRRDGQEVSDLLSQPDAAPQGNTIAASPELPRSRSMTDFLKLRRELAR